MAGQEQNQNRTNAALAYSTLKRRILDNVYSAGLLVSVKDLSEELGMSRTPLRDALIRLEEERLVSLVPRHGFLVLPMAPQEVLEILHIIAGLELLSIDLIIERGLDPEEAVLLQTQIDRMQEAISVNDINTWSEIDQEFHFNLVDMSRNQTLADEVRRFREKTIRAHSIGISFGRAPSKSTDNHRKLVEFIIRRDRKAAYEVHRSQRFGSAKETFDILSKIDFRYELPRRLKVK